MIRKTMTLFLLFCLALSNGSEAQQKPAFVIVVNPDVPVKEISAKELGRIFLKKRQTWENDKKIMAVDQSSSNDLREEFSEFAHQKKTANIKAFWQKQIFSGRSVPPPEKASDDLVLEYVQETPGAIGYVSASADIGDYKVKKLEIKKD
ncbi:MAG TPA: substrate-binding domain-containing protein [Calditrichia bacterium]|nr:substrate-binding domain-containing protein [Calditrichota bacterium]HQU73248.1 substrate-binding domain-containing protein [Calditrichia bacterium]HQV30317.1 substrate-binding domain-containing protein [Calditrichia bacterium]